MKPAALALASVLAIAARASAQPASDAPATAHLPAFLEQRVVEELISDGILLSRLGVTLEIALVGDIAIVSLIDAATGRARASTKIDHLPADRDAAVASTTQVAASLVDQLGPRKEAPAPETLAKALAEHRAKEREERQQSAVAEARYRESALGFSEEVTMFVASRDGTITAVDRTRRWTAFQGEQRIELEPHEFYELVQRGDLIEAYDRRRAIRNVTAVVGGAMSTLSTYLILTSDFGDPGMKVGIALGLGAVVPLTISGWYWARPHPITETQAKVLATKYNGWLRRSLGLPSAARDRGVLREVAWAPYATPDGAGIALGGRF